MKQNILLFLLSTNFPIVYSFTPSIVPVSQNHLSISSKCRQKQYQRRSAVSDKNGLKMLTYAKKSDDDDSNDFFDESLDFMREQFEDIYSTRAQPTDDIVDENGRFVVAHRFVHSLTKESPTPALTSNVRLLRETEIEILANLHEEAKMSTLVHTLHTQDDEGTIKDYVGVGSNRKTEQHLLESLQNFWNRERGPNAAQELETIDDCLQRYHNSEEIDDAKRKDLLTMAEDRLHTLIDDHDPFWVEPFHRLSMVYYWQDRLEEAKQLEEWVLSVKPWHISALSNLVRIAEAQKNGPLAIQWAKRRLPSIYSNGGRRRITWFQSALEEAKAMLSEEDEKSRQKQNILLSSWNNNSFEQYDETQALDSGLDGEGNLAWQ